MTAPVELGAGALDEALKTLVGVHAHWYAVFEIVVVTVTVEGPGAGAAEEEEADATVEMGAAEVEIVLTNRPPMMLELLLAPLTAFFR